MRNAIIEKYYKKDMANTGYVSIGHLTRLMSDENKIQVLRDFCKVLTQEISESYINKDSLIYRFDLFFSNSDWALNSDSVLKILHRYSMSSGVLSSSNETETSVLLNTLML